MDMQRMTRTVGEGIALTASALSLYVIIRMLAGPDAIVRAKMLAYRTTARTAGKVAEGSLNIGMRANSAYHKCRNATV